MLSFDRTYEELKQNVQIVNSSVPASSFDRTYEELKPEYRGQPVTISVVGFDRTYEELKHTLKYCGTFYAGEVLIVPMRN